MKVLIVEDEQMLNNIIAKRLRWIRLYFHI